MLVARGQLVRADVAAVAPRGDDQFADGGGVAQAEIQSLRADRRHHMRRLADEDDAIAAEAARDLDRERKHATSGLHCHLAEKRMRAPLDLGGELGVGQRRQARSIGGVHHADQA